MSELTGLFVVVRAEDDIERHVLQNVETLLGVLFDDRRVVDRTVVTANVQVGALVLLIDRRLKRHVTGSVYV